VAAVAELGSLGHKNMRHLFLIYFATVVVCFCSDEDSSWSKIENDLRGRLIILPSESKDSPFYRIFIELQNTDNSIGQLKIRFDLKRLSFKVTDKDNNELPDSNGAYSGFTPLWEPLLLPYRGIIRFQISFPGLGFPPEQRGIIDLGPSYCWIISQNEPNKYLSATFTVEREDGDHPYMDWHGTIVFPPTIIPKQE
jgi:hypothetical protein